MARKSPLRLTDDGYTLVEVVIAMLLVSIMVTSVFSVALTAKQGGGKGVRKLLAAQGAKQVSGVLKNFVTGDETTTMIAGPGGGNGWAMSNGVVTAACPGGGTNCYAMASGTHTLTGVLPAWFEAAPYNARVRYFVNNSVTINGRPMPNVTITTDWTEP
jgi:prepilin-type N-terminal cleavage/methylation domain-containing protein